MPWPVNLQIAFVLGACVGFVICRIWWYLADHIRHEREFKYYSEEFKRGHAKLEAAYWRAAMQDRRRN